MISEPARTRRRPPLPRWLLITLAGLAVAAVLSAAAATVWAITSGLQLASARPPAVGTTIVTPEESKAARAAAAGTLSPQQQVATEYLAEQPTAYWLTPELDPIGEVGGRVLALAQEAREQDAALAVVIYGLPERDCADGHSGGGLDDVGYDSWTGEIGAALGSVKDAQKIVVLEPDSLALGPECGNVDERVIQLQQAVDRLEGTDTWIYLDGGHSNWLPAEEMAGLIQQVGRADRVRGFATNVSNYNATTDEFAYAHDVAAALGGGHAVVDTSRNGAGPYQDEWCNPPGRLIGEPGGTYGDDVVDTNLWIKPPGESDGTCNGGPPAGDWWPEAAVTLTRDAQR